MILGDGPLAAGAREAFGDVPFIWILHQPPLQTLDLPGGLGATVVLSTPSPIGKTRILMGQYPEFDWAYLPENVREAHPEDWLTQARHVIGTESDVARKVLFSFFKKHGTHCEFMGIESAEMTKHAINGFLALEVRYANEIARVAKLWGANPYEVARGLMTDPRIGQGAYLKPDGGISEHLQREVDNLEALGFAL